MVGCDTQGRMTTAWPSYSSTPLHSTMSTLRRSERTVKDLKGFCLFVCFSLSPTCYKRALASWVKFPGETKLQQEAGDEAPTNIWVHCSYDFFSVRHQWNTY